MGIPDEIEGAPPPPPPPHTHTGSFVPVLQKCPELGGSVYNIFWKFKILLGFFLIIVGQTFQIMLIN
jgi:hypothetical protein